MTIRTTISNASYSFQSGLHIDYYDSKLDSSLDYDNAGNSKPTVVLLHGYCGSSAYFKEIVPYLSAYAEILIIDLPGHGTSQSLAQETYALTEQSELVLEWLRGINVHQFHMFGHSLGGYITLAVAAQKPEGLQSFGLLHSTALPDSPQGRNNRDQAVINVQEQGVAGFVDQLVPKLLGSDDPVLLQTLATIGYETEEAAVIGFARGMKERPDHSNTIKSSQLPVLLVSGAKDAIVSAEGTFAGKGDSSVTVIIEDAGHMGMLETPQQLAEIIKVFIEGRS